MHTRSHTMLIHNTHMHILTHNAHTTHKHTLIYIHTHAHTLTHNVDIAVLTLLDTFFKEQIFIGHSRNKHCLCFHDFLIHIIVLVPQNSLR